PLPQLALAAEGQVRLQWIASPKSDLARYLIYQSPDEAAAEDIRTMMLVARVAASPSSAPKPGEQLPITVPGKQGLLEFAVQAPPGNYLFRMVAEDDAENRSHSSGLMR